MLASIVADSLHSIWRLFWPISRPIQIQTKERLSYATSAAWPDTIQVAPSVLLQDQLERLQGKIELNLTLASLVLNAFTNQ